LFVLHLGVRASLVEGVGRGNGDKCFMVHEVFQRGAIGVPGLRAEVLGLLVDY